MVSSAVPSPARDSLADLQARFQALLPRVELHARVFFRHLKCPDRKQDAINETLALAWKWFVHLAEQGKDPSRFPAAFATLIARSVRCGRRLAGMEKAKDVRWRLWRARLLLPGPATGARGADLPVARPGGQKRAHKGRENCADTIQRLLCAASARHQDRWKAPRVFRLPSSKRISPQCLRRHPKEDFPPTHLVRPQRLPAHPRKPQRARQ